MRRFTTVLVLGGLWWSGVDSARAEGETTHALWSELMPVSARIDVRARVVRFAGDAPAPRVTLGEYEVVSLAPRGDRCLVYDYECGRGRMYDANGQLTAALKTDKRYAGLLVSDAGLIAFFSPLYPEPTLTQEVRLYGADGAERWSVPETRFCEPDFRLRFSPDGRFLAVLARTPSGGPEPRATAVLFDGQGERWALDVSPGLAPADIAFGHQGRRIAFGVCRYQDDGRRDNRVWVWEADRSALRELVCPNVGQFLGAGSLAFAPGDERVIVNGLGKVQMYDVSSGAQVWSTELNDRDRRADILETAVQLAVVGEHIVVAQRINAPSGRLKYALSVLNLDGQKLAQHVVGGAQPRQADVGRFWDIASDGRSVEIHLEPSPTTIRLP